ncbi:Glyoxalase/Bleomycin resistance protein/Dihydroxybiphenyl dioxygenase [Aspergillus pseudoustus]|uniref:Glyoxalase/Bleomycin resistance protein/Dihydroxybiphenyl dioxygenase n=1 Tax=Aspergillus pseudoustus TaxID=1810923 RepID=A0ABR4KHW9_9EURO
MTSTTTATNPPPLTHILETCLYVQDIAASVKFYQETLNIAPFLESPRVTAFSLGTTTLLLFELGQTGEDIHTPSGTIPLHGPTAELLASLRHSHSHSSVEKGEEEEQRQSLRQHFCLAVQSPEQVEQWEKHLRAQGVQVLSRMGWERGGKSVYFEDLDGHVVEIASKGVWPHY